MCNQELTEMVGNQMYPNHPDHGITLDCKNQGCPAQDVMGWGKNAKDAYKVIQEKYVRREERK